MRNTLLFSLALGLTVTATEAKASKVATRVNLSAATAYSSSRLIQNTVQGTVSDTNGPLAGVTVSVVGVPGAVTTDANGKFKITAELGSTLRFSSIGYTAKDVKVSSGTVDVILDLEDNSLDEVVVVGYGTQKKAHLTGAVSSINVAEVMGSRPVPDAARGMQGTMPGLSVTIPSGEVGSDPIMKIRGQVGSIEGSSNPLILVDNVEIPSINMVNPSDIETITVLKDAASSSIYGAKAAFGVILITTKKGANSDSHNVTYTNNISTQSPFKPIELAGVDGLEYTLEAAEAQGDMTPDGLAGGFWRVSRESLEKTKQWLAEYGDKVKYNDPVVFGRDWYVQGATPDKVGIRLYDPVAAMLKNNPISHLHNLGLNGKSGKTNYNFGLGFLNQQGMMKPAEHDDFRRYNATLSLSTKVNDFLTLRGGAMYSDGTKRYPYSLTGFGANGDPWVYLYRWSLLFPVGVTDQHGAKLKDPATMAEMSNTASKIDRFMNLNLGTTVDLLKGWDLKVDYAYSTQNNNVNTSLRQVNSIGSLWYKPDVWLDESGQQVYVDEYGVPTDNGGTPGYKFGVDNITNIGEVAPNIYKKTLFSKRHTFNAFSTYGFKIEEKHDLKFMAGTNIVAYKWEDFWTRKLDLINQDNPQFNFAVGDTEGGGDTNWDSQVGFFGRANYTFSDKYLLEGNIRYDGTSKFPTHLRWRWYPSVSAGWVISNESFMKDVSNVVSFAKLRGSWGNIGDQSVSNTLYVPTMSITQNDWLNGSGQKVYQLGTPGAVSTAITWQDIEHANLGMDLRFFNKVGVVVEAFQRTTANMIIPGDALPNTYGVSAPRGNYGSLRTRGWELSLDYSHKFENGLRIAANANLADAISVTTKGADWNTPWENRSLATTYSTGRTYGDIFGYVSDRLYQAEDFVYDANNNHVVTSIIHNGSSRLTNQLAGDNPVYQTQFQTGNAVWGYISPGDMKFVDVNGDGYINQGTNTNGDPGDRVKIGNSTPRYEYGFRLGADYKGFDLAVFMQGVGKREIWGVGQLTTPGFHVKDGAMPQAIAEDFWKKDRTDAFYPRALNASNSNNYQTMVPQSRYLLDMSYFKIKNITFGYSLSDNVLNRVKMKNARIYVSLENYFLFDKLRGLPIDPETISGVSMLASGYNQGRTGIGNPSFKSASIGIQLGL